MPRSAQSPAEAWLDRHRHRPPLVRMFVQRMPKGGDLHNHFGGALYAEDYIELGAEKAFCWHRAHKRLVPGPCQSDARRPVAELLSDPAAYNAAIDALSTRNRDPESRSGHARFFSTFARFSAAARANRGAVLAAVLARAAQEHVGYLELQGGAGSGEAAALGEQVGFDGDMAAMLGRLVDAGLDARVRAGREMVDRVEADARALLQCGTPAAGPGCDVTVRYLQMAVRTRSPARVFARLAYGFLLAQADPRVVGINIAAPEDDRVALRDYRLHMEIIGYLKQRYPDVGVTLHAGELTMGLVEPRHLTSHIRQAVELAGAQRIGHGVSLAYEHDAPGLLDVMRRREILVEVCLTSNDTILEVSGANHPLPEYLHAGVPVALATDDAGVSRIDLSHEYYRAVMTYGLRYSDLKAMVRNSVHYSFLPGQSLWSGPAYEQFVPACAGANPGRGDAELSAPCRAFLAQHPRAAEAWRLERALAEFEALPWLRQTMAAPRRISNRS